MKQKTTHTYSCDHCPEHHSFATEAQCLWHEDHCPHNPDVRACETCVNLQGLRCASGAEGPYRNNCRHWVAKVAR